MKVVDINSADKPLMTLKQINDAIEGFKVFAQLNHSYYTSLIEQGFTEAQALEMPLSG